MNRNIRILVVDDFSIMRSILKNLLLDLGYGNIAEAEDGDAALPIITRGGVDFLITDWNMPGMTGIELLKSIRAIESIASLPVLMVTAASEKYQIVEAMKCGVSGYIVKPFSSQVLKEKIGNIIDRVSG